MKDGTSRWWPLVLALFAQALLLCWNPGRLPLWGDEVWTLRLANEPASRIVQMTAADIHPPLYYFLQRAWISVPLPGDPVARLRLLSALFALAATFALDRLWLRETTGNQRTWFLALWTLSPCLLLYGRMGRSYTLQLLLGVIAAGCGWRLLERGRTWGRIAAFAAAAAALLYVHYAPGIAVLAGTAFALLWRRRVRDAALVSAGALLLYLPWLFFMGEAIGKWRASSGYLVSQAGWKEHIIKLGYSFVSFSFGEAIPDWLIPAVLLTGVGVAWLLAAGVRDLPPWLGFLSGIAVVLYVGVARWVSYAFVPARALLLLPFFLLLLVRARERYVRAGTAVLCALLAVSCAGAWSYFEGEDFLNKAYCAPLDKIAAVIRAGAAGSVVVVDGYNTDPSVLKHYLAGAAPVCVVLSEQSWAECRAQAGGARRVWVFRNTHDISPGKLNERLESELLTGAKAEERLYLPYSHAQRAAMRLLRLPEQPTHYYRLARFDREPD